MGAVKPLCWVAYLTCWLTGCGLIPPSPQAPRDFVADFQPPLSEKTGNTITGWGGGGDTLAHVPIIFVHGNTVSPEYWRPAQRAFKQSGYSDDELWAVGYGYDSVRLFDSNDKSILTLERFINAVTGYLEEKYQRPIPQVDIVAHSLGVTLARQWMKQNNAWHRVRRFVGIAGANHGVWTARADSTGVSRRSGYELHRNSPWLAQLNRGGETPGATAYFTLYDGTGRYDVFFPAPDQDSSALEGALNVAYNRDRGGFWDHIELGQATETLTEVNGFLSPATLPSVTAVRPQVRYRAEDQTQQFYASDDAQLHCVSSNDAKLAAYPSKRTPASTTRPVIPGVFYTCFAYNPATELASPIVRFSHSQAGTQDKGTTKGTTKAITITATPSAGAYGLPQQITLKATEPVIGIVYSVNGAVPSSGSPLYTQPIYLSGDSVLQARALLPNGQLSDTVTLEYKINQATLDATRTLRQQLQ